MPGPHAGITASQFSLPQWSKSHAVSILWRDTTCVEDGTFPFPRRAQAHTVRIEHFPIAHVANVPLTEYYTGHVFDNFGAASMSTSDATGMPVTVRVTGWTASNDSSVSERAATSSWDECASPPVFFWTDAVSTQTPDDYIGSEDFRS